MLLVILGAGASYDSKPPTIPVADEGFAWQPPLTSGLFHPEAAWSDILDRFTVLASAMPEITSRLDRGHALEEILEDWLSQSENSRTRRSHLMAVRYALAGSLSHISNNWHNQILNRRTSYAQLVATLLTWSELSKTEVAFVTFNYDLLLEFALADLHRFNLREVDNWIVGDHPKVFKPHGSCNWLHALTPEASERYRQAKTATRSLEQLFIDDPPAPADFEDQIVTGGGMEPEIRAPRDAPKRYGIPAIAVPVQYKLDSAWEMPQTHKAAMLDAFREATAVFVIGWRAAERHILEKMVDCCDASIPIQLLCGPDAYGDPTEENLRHAGFTSVENRRDGLSHFLHQDGMKQVFAALARP